MARVGKRAVVLKSMREAYTWHQQLASTYSLDIAVVRCKCGLSTFPTSQLLRLSPRKIPRPLLHASPLARTPGHASSAPVIQLPRLQFSPSVDCHYWNLIRWPA